MTAAIPEVNLSRGTTSTESASSLPQHPQPPSATTHTQQTTNSAQNQTPSAQNKTQNRHSSQNRHENTTICLPIVYGSIAFPLPKTEEYNTHKWTLFIRGPNNEDISQGIAKVVFHLHPSFAQPVRELTAPPFEVTEKGWGEFEASIRIVWRDPAEKALVLMHMIKLYPPVDKNVNVPGSGTGVGDGSASSGDKKEGKPVIHEFYDEVVFTNPTELFHTQLLGSSLPTGDVPKVKSQEPSVQEMFKPYSDEEDFTVLLEAQRFLESELISVKDRILRADCNKFELDAALAQVSAKVKAAAAAASSAAASAAAPAKRKSKASGGGTSKKAKTTSASSTSK